MFRSWEAILADESLALFLTGSLCLLVNVSPPHPHPTPSRLVHVLAWDVWAGVELDAVHCVTGTIYAIRERAGRGEVVLVACEICWQDWHLDDGYL